MDFSLFPDVDPAAFSSTFAPPLSFSRAALTTDESRGRLPDSSCPRETSGSRDSLFRQFLQRHCPELDSVVNVTSAMILSKLSEQTDACTDKVTFWRRLATELLDVVTATVTVTSPSVHSAVAPVHQTTLSRIASLRSPLSALGESPAALLRSPTAMLSKADIGDEADDGSYTVNQHVILMPLGHGAQGEVALAMDTRKNELRAIKSIRRPKGMAPLPDGLHAARGALGAAKAARRLQIEREINVMKRCRHRNIVALYEVIDDPNLDVMYLVMQYVEKGPIARLRTDWTIEKPIDPIKLATYTVQLCAGLSYLHRKGVIHRDIKPDNVLIGSRDDVYLADFGTADLFNMDESRRIIDYRGTAAFMAPELFAEDGAESAHGESVDIWALGITLFVLLYGRLPWRSTSPGELTREVSAAVLNFPGSDPRTGPPAPLSNRPDSAQSLATFQDVDLEETSAGLQLPSFSYDVTMCESMSTMRSANDCLTPTRRETTRAERSSARQRRRVVVQDASAQWATLLAEILQKDPTRRIPLASISARAQHIIDQHQSAGLLGASVSGRDDMDGSSTEPITLRTQSCAL